MSLKANTISAWLVAKLLNPCWCWCLGDNLHIGRSCWCGKWQWGCVLNNLNNLFSYTFSKPKLKAFSALYPVQPRSLEGYYARTPHFMDEDMETQSQKWLAQSQHSWEGECREWLFFMRFSRVLGERHRDLCIQEHWIHDVSCGLG